VRETKLANADLQQPEEREDGSKKISDGGWRRIFDDWGEVEETIEARLPGRWQNRPYLVVSRVYPQVRELGI
jgi:hypothetical protein